jgi:hypothetical protein
MSISIDLIDSKYQVRERKLKNKNLEVNKCDRNITKKYNIG